MLTFPSEIYVYIYIYIYFPFRKLRVQHSTITPFLTTHQQSSNRCLKLSLINKKTSDLSRNKEEFGKVKCMHETAIKDSGHFSSTSFSNSNTQNARRNGNREVPWFNLPYSQSVKTNIGKLFIKLLRKHFPKKIKYHKIFNLNTLVLTYCCTTSVRSIIKQNNFEMLSKINDGNNCKGNCRSKPNFPWSGECLDQCLLYKATSTTSNNSFVYYGSS